MRRRLSGPRYDRRQSRRAHALPGELRFHRSGQASGTGRVECAHSICSSGCRPLCYCLGPGGAQCSRACTRQHRRPAMLYKPCLFVLVALLGMGVAEAAAFDDAQYPDLRGAWFRIGSGSYDPMKPSGLGQQAPLTPAYQKILEQSLADQASGGQGENPGYRCASHGMPRVMIATVPIEFVVLPEITYVALERLSQLRRIYTDGRGWPARLQHSTLGTSIGRWIDEDGDARYDVLEVETRGIKGPHVYDASGIAFHPDERAIVRERIRLDKASD